MQSVGKWRKPSYVINIAILIREMTIKISYNSNIDTIYLLYCKLYFVKY